MNRLLLLIVLSLAANVVLAGWWIKERQRTPAVAIGSMQPSPADANLDPESSQQLAPKPALPATSPVVPSEIPAATASISSWKDLQADDLKEFIRRLRTAGCPEETLQDIIVAEVNRRHSARARELWPERNVAKAFWEVEKQSPEDTRRNRERYRKDRELQKEKSALLVELLGVDPEKERRKAEGLPEYIDYNERRISFLPESKREAASKILEDFEARFSDFYARNRGMYDAEYRTERAQLEAERMQALAQHLTPQQLREYEIRESQLASQLRHDLRGLTVTREEYETIYDIRKKYGESIYNYSDVEGKAARDQVERNKEALEADLAAALGPEKSRDYKRSQDYSYSELTRLARRHDLPVETSGKVYDFKEAAEAAVKQLKADTGLSNSERQAALAKIREETQQAVIDTLGGNVFTNYLRRGGYWINNLAPTPRPVR